MKFIIYIKERTGLFLMLMVIGVILSYSGKEHASAQNVYVDDQGFYYTENTDGTFNVAAYQGEGGSVTIPERTNDGQVVSILDGVFYKNSTITNIYIPDTITTIGIDAFGYCTKLKSVRLPQKLTAIPMECFVYCSSLTKITLPSSCSQIGYNAFSACKNLYQVNVTKNVKSITSSSFTDCNKKRLTIVAPKNSYAVKYAKKYSIMTTTSKATKLSNKSKSMIAKEKFQLYLYNPSKSIKWKSNHSSIASVNSGGKITAKRNGKVTITAICNGKSYSCKITVKAKTNSSTLRVIYKQYVKPGMSDYEKVAAAHKWLIQNVKYDKRLYTTGTVPYVSHTAIGAFKYGVAVCDGYSKAFMTIMEHYNIPCMMVTGGQHAWNLVKIKNKWYHVDCTYDDPIVNWSFNNTHVYKTYFLKTDAYMAKDHTWLKKYFPKAKSTSVDKNYRTK